MFVVQIDRGLAGLGQPLKGLLGHEINGAAQGAHASGRSRF
jgi:hypothetical protein